MSILYRRLFLGSVITACAAAAVLPGAAQAYPYWYGYRGGYGYRGFGAGLLAGGIYGGYYGGYYAPRPYYVAPPVVYAPPVYDPAPRVAYEVPPPVSRAVVHRPRTIHHAAAAPAACVPPVLTGPLPKAPLQSP